MKRFNEHDTVIYTDAEGRRIDTFVIFDTDTLSGLTQINHESLRVTADKLELHPSTVEGHHLPMQDAFSFEIFKRLKEKDIAEKKQPVKRHLKAKPAAPIMLALAS